MKTAFTSTHQNLCMQPTTVIKVKNWLAAFIACFLFCIGPCCFAQTRQCTVFDPSYNDIVALQKSGVLRVGVHDNERPWSWRDDQGNWSGYDVDLCLFLAHQLGVKARFIPLHYHNPQELESLIRQDKIDLASPETPVPINSLEYLLISKPYEKKDLAILFNHLTYNTSSVQQAMLLIDSNKAMVGALDNQQEIRYIQQSMPGVEIVHYRTTTALTAGLQKKHVTVVIGNYKELNNWLSKRPSRRLHYELLDIPNTSENISLVTGPKHWRLLQWLNVNLNYQEHNSGAEFQVLKAKYLT